MWPSGRDTPALERLGLLSNDMTRFVLDATALVELAQAGNALPVGHQLVAPYSVRSRAMDILLREVRSGMLGEKAALVLHERMTAISIRLLGDRVSRRTAWRIAQDHDWDSLDNAEYIAVTQLQADALVAMNPDLAHKAQGIVRLASLKDVLTR